MLMYAAGVLLLLRASVLGVPHLGIPSTFELSAHLEAFVCRQAGQEVLPGQNVPEQHQQ